MIRLCLLLTGLYLAARRRVADRPREARDEGGISLETVIIALGLFLLAVALVAGLTAAFNGRLAQIN